MENQVKRLVEKAWKKYEETPENRRLRKLHFSTSGMSPVPEPEQSSFMAIADIYTQSLE
jgi:hypothetical protein